MLKPVLSLAFENKQDADIAATQHLCLCRNEDVLYPSEIIETTSEEFNSNSEEFNGFELVFEENEKSFLVGYNRYNEGRPMYGWLRVVGNPINTFQ